MQAIRETSKRIEWIDIVKGICMFCVVLSHSGTTLLYSRIYTPFFLTAFFFVSGFTFSPKENFKTYLLHKMQTILIPYWCFGIINTLLAHIADGDKIGERLIGLLLSINRKNDDLWFIMCFFILQLLFYGLWRKALRSNKKFDTIASITIALILMTCGYGLIYFNIAPLPLQFETALIMLPYMLGGYLYRSKFKAYQPNGGGCTVCLLAYLLSVLLYSNIVNIHAETYTNIPVFFATSVIGTATIVAVSQQIRKKHSDSLPCRALIFIGQNTFIYYALQSKAIRLLDVVYARLPFSISEYIRCLIYSVIVCFILAIVAIVINKWFPFLLGKRYKKTVQTNQRR